MSRLAARVQVNATIDQRGTDREKENKQTLVNKGQIKAVKMDVSK